MFVALVARWLSFQCQLHLPVRSHHYPACLVTPACKTHDFQVPRWCKLTPKGVYACVQYVNNRCIYIYIYMYIYTIFELNSKSSYFTIPQKWQSNREVSVVLYWLYFPSMASTHAKSQRIIYIYICIYLGAECYMNIMNAKWGIHFPIAQMKSVFSFRAFALSRFLASWLRWLEPGVREPSPTCWPGHSDGSGAERRRSAGIRLWRLAQRPRQPRLKVEKCWEMLRDVEIFVL